MKMAKANDKEIQAAIDLAKLTDAVCNTRRFEEACFPGENESDPVEGFDKENPADLRKFYDRVSKLSPGLMRVAFGYATLVDNVCNPNSDVLEYAEGVLVSNVGPKDRFPFGVAVELLKQGKLVSREGWNGKGMYLWLLPAATIKAEWCREPWLKNICEANGGQVEALGSVRMMTADGKVLTGWLASQSDMLAEDWMICPTAYDLAKECKAE